MGQLYTLRYFAQAISCSPAHVKKEPNKDQRHRLICRDCAVKLKLSIQWDSSAIGNLSDTCAECGRKRHLREVLML